jgi:hypothetical protein
MATCTFLARALAAIGRGDHEEAYREATKPAPAGTMPSHVPYALWTILELVEAAVRTGRHAEAAAHVQTLLDNEVASLSPRLSLVTRGAAAIAARDDPDLALFRHALAQSDAARWPFDRARIQMIFGERLRRRRAVTDAREQRFHLNRLYPKLGINSRAALRDALSQLPPHQPG